MGRKFMIQEFPILLMFMLVMSFGSYGEDCASYSFWNNKNYKDCESLHVLDSFLHWTYHPRNHTVDLAYRRVGVEASDWVSWAVNFDGKGMIGAQCLVAFHDSSDGVFTAYTSPISSYKTKLEAGDLSFQVSRISGEYRRDHNEMIIYATLHLPDGRTRFSHLWQSGEVSNGVPRPHSFSKDHLNSMGAIDFLPGQGTNSNARNSKDDVDSTGQGTSSRDRGTNSRQRKKYIHGVLNVVSWGMMMPMGAIIARHMKVFRAANPAWFYLHSSCQSSAYIVGVAGWATGLKLGSGSPGVTYNPHRIIGITLFCLGTLQVFALLLRPKPEHKLRFYWNIYHHITGYTVIVLSIVNVFKGLNMLEVEMKWRMGYIGFLIFLGGFAIFMEAFTWHIVLKRRKETSSSSATSTKTVEDQEATTAAA
ncbi:hypothetical protein LIER_39585 [Lithospermum erythrorhizon]|uniref:Cytochrome b561 and DOMON domain-containing protein n=1 Tax=Lithospermum erythrorhizon TaxID=34254 RepID=A0AAV3QKY3_LITER